MKLIDSLYTVTKTGETEYAVTLNPEHVIYKAHFPGRPITPGVCLVQMVGEVLGLHLGRTLTLTAVKNAKFIATVEPAATPTFTLSLSRIAVADDGSASTQATMLHDGQPLAKMSLRYV